MISDDWCHVILVFQALGNQPSIHRPELYCKDMNSQTIYWCNKIRLPQTFSIQKNNVMKSNSYRSNGRHTEERPFPTENGRTENRNLELSRARSVTKPNEPSPPCFQDPVLVSWCDFWWKWIFLVEMRQGRTGPSLILVGQLSDVRLPCLVLHWSSARLSQGGRSF